MQRSTIKNVVAIVVLCATALSFGYYLHSHPEIWSTLKQTRLMTLAFLAGLYMIVLCALSFVTFSTLAICNTSISKRESTLLTMYTAIVNFFGPLQSGPAFRGLYLRKKHGLAIKQYAAATLVFYAIYGTLCLVMLLSGVLGWWLVVIIIVMSLFLYRFKSSDFVTGRFLGLNMTKLYILVLATSLQLVLVTLIYFVELRTVLPHVGIGQSIVYSGAANLALFVSLTPGAIGFRESFLYLSQQLHHIPPKAIVAANILDRSVYIAILLLVALFIFGTHSQQSLIKATKNKSTNL